jgi:hypothetical protein
MRAQVTLTVPESKLLIAKAVASFPEVRNALKNGKILLKGGTTVSALSELLAKMPLRISGRITPRGTASAKHVVSEHPHSVLVEKGRVRNVDETFVDKVAELGRGDVVVIGANALDVHGNAAMMAGAPLGGRPGRAISGMMAEGVTVIIAVGLEKLIPNSISEAVMAAGRKNVDQAYGMAVGLIPLVGRVVTEREALTILADVKCTIIGRGGISGAEGATTMVIEGDSENVKKALRIVVTVKGAKTSGLEKSLAECEVGSEACKIHLACIYSEAGKTQPR